MRIQISIWGFTTIRGTRFGHGSSERAARSLDDRDAPGLVTAFGEWGPGVNGGGWLRIAAITSIFFIAIGAVRAAIDECLAGDPQTIYQLGHPFGFHNQIYAGEINFCRPLFDRGGKVTRLKRMVARIRKNCAAQSRESICLTRTSRSRSQRSLRGAAT